MPSDRAHLLKYLEDQFAQARDSGIIGPTEKDRPFGVVQKIIENERKNAESRANQSGFQITSFITSEKSERQLEVALDILKKAALRRSGSYSILNTIRNQKELPNSKMPFDDPYLLKLGELLRGTAHRHMELITVLIVDDKSPHAIPPEYAKLAENPLVVDIVAWIDEHPVFANDFFEVVDRHHQFSSRLFNTSYGFAIAQSRRDLRELSDKVAMRGMLSLYEELCSTFERLKADQTRKLQRLQKFSTGAGDDDIVTEPNVDAKKLDRTALKHALDSLGLQQIESSTTQTTGITVGGAYSTLVHLSNNLVAKRMKTSALPMEIICIRALREARALHKLNHDRILRLVGYWVDPEGYPSLVSVYHPEGNLLEYLKRSGSGLSRSEKLTLSRDIAEALEYLHNLVPPVIHADVKCLNVLVSNQKRGILCDFGVSRLGDKKKGYTTSGVSYTAPWRAPELLLWDNAFRSPNTFTDIYAFGGLCFEIASNGKAPGYWIAAHDESLDDDVDDSDNPIYRDHSHTPGDEPYPNLVAKGQVLDAVENKYPPVRQEDWAFIMRCWDRNPWKRPSAKDAMKEIDLLIELERIR